MPLIDLALVNNVWTLKLSMIQTVGLAVITLFIGTWINKHSKFLQRMCMPAPAVATVDTSVQHTDFAGYPKFP